MAEEVTKKLQLLGKIWGAVNALKTGKVGQLIRVSAVDENGGIAALESVDDVKELPEVTSDDNGKVMVVVGGVWKPVKVEIPEAEKELPEPTAEDNGKFLQVVNGAWTAVDAVPQVTAIVNAVIEEALGGDY